MKILVIPDVHGRDFWKKPCEDISQYDKVIFLGDYLDPYDFEHIDVLTAIDIFKQIIEFKQENMGKVVLLLGNHDFPYVYDSYYNLSYYHSRHSKEHHDEIHSLFAENLNLFNISFVADDILFTHAGINSSWYNKVFGDKEIDINLISTTLNELPNSPNGMELFYMVSFYRGGYDACSSCIWADVHETQEDMADEGNKIRNIKQVFGHTIQAYYDKDYKIAYGDIMEFCNCKMLDNAAVHILDTETFKIV